jgi:hypothetical protein
LGGGTSSAPVVHFSARGAQLTSPSLDVSLGLGQIGRGRALEPIAANPVYGRGSARYCGASACETLVSRAGSIEQSFLVPKAPAGRGPLVIEVPVHGLRAQGAGQTIALWQGGKAMAPTRGWS